MSIEIQPLPPRQSVAEDINRLHAEAEILSAESRDKLHGALEAAWKAGKLLVMEKAQVRRTMGPGAWQLWLERHFVGTPRTAQRYMRLAITAADPSSLQGMSLRQVYFRLGIATEPKSPARSTALRTVARHASLAVRLLGILPISAASPLSPELKKTYRQDLRPLYERLRLLFE